ncbi:MAG TPA: DUF4256 domain-containing protein [Gemmatimonadaceae bacterium]|nr:DUF4256 domain-containing protein [Gemmatimonadaceae bacterium]
MPKANPAEKLLATLEQRFTANAARHPGLPWAAVRKRLDANAAALKVLQAMEDTGGEPDVTAVDKKSGRLTFTDCSPESPAGRRSLCYDRAALDARKEAKPKSSALEVAAKIGIRVLTEDEYRALQELGEFDLKTSSWILTPAPIRKLGGALFCDRRYDQVFTYHNGAQSYYGARGFRGCVEV